MIRVIAALFVSAVSLAAHAQTTTNCTRIGNQANCHSYSNSGANSNALLPLIAQPVTPSFTAQDAMRLRLQAQQMEINRLQIEQLRAQEEQLRLQRQELINRYADPPTR